MGANKDSGLIAKARLLGCNEYIDIGNSKTVELVSKSKYNHILYIPDNIVSLNISRKESLVNNTVNNRLRKLRGDIRLVGGDNLQSVANILCHCRFDSADLSELTFDNVKYTTNMLGSSHIDHIDLSNINTVNVRSMAGMCNYAIIKDLDLSKLKLDNVTTISNIFTECKIDNLNLNNWCIDHINTSVWLERSNCLVRANTPSVIKSLLDYGAIETPDGYRLINLDIHNY